MFLTTVNFSNPFTVTLFKMTSPGPPQCYMSNAVRNECLLRDMSLSSTRRGMAVAEISKWC
jgi:hypothetical protein